MAKDTKNLQPVTVNPQGMNDNAPSQALPSWFRVFGAHQQGQQFLQRIGGKILRHKLPAPILGIHGDLRTRIYIETTQAIYQLETITDLIPPLI